MSKRREIINLNVAGDYISETIDLLADSDRYEQKERYIEILETALNDLNTVMGAIRIEESLIKTPNLADKVIE